MQVHRWDGSSRGDARRERCGGVYKGSDRAAMRLASAIRAFGPAAGRAAYRERPGGFVKAHDLKAKKTVNRRCRQQLCQALKTGPDFDIVRHACPGSAFSCHCNLTRLSQAMESLIDVLQKYGRQHWRKGPEGRSLRSKQASLSRFAIARRSRVS